MTAKIRYRIKNALDAKRLAELVDSDNPTELESEIGVARLMLESAYNKGDYKAVESLTKTIAKLAQVSDMSKYRNNELLSKSAIVGIVGKIVEVLTSNIQGRFDGWENTLNATKDQMLTIVCEAKNEEENEGK